METELKKVLTFEEAAKYMGVSKSCLYKLTSQKLISHYKPNGKMIFFDREELEAYLLSVRVKPQSELKLKPVHISQKVLSQNNNGLQNEQFHNSCFFRIRTFFYANK